MMTVDIKKLDVSSRRPWLSKNTMSVLADMEIIGNKALDLDVERFKAINKDRTK